MNSGSEKGSSTTTSQCTAAQMVWNGYNSSYNSTNRSFFGSKNIIYIYEKCLNRLLSVRNSYFLRSYRVFLNHITTLRIGYLLQRLESVIPYTIQPSSIRYGDSGWISVIISQFFVLWMIVFNFNPFSINSYELAVLKSRSELAQSYRFQCGLETCFRYLNRAER